MQIVHPDDMQKFQKVPVIDTIIRLGGALQTGILAVTFVLSPADTYSYLAPQDSVRLSMLRVKVDELKASESRLHTIAGMQTTLRLDNAIIQSLTGQRIWRGSLPVVRPIHPDHANSPAEKLRNALPSVLGQDILQRYPLYANPHTGQVFLFTQEEAQRLPIERRDA